MNITISDNNASLKFIQSNGLILSQYQKRSNRTIVIWVAIAIILITYDILTFNDWSWKSGIEPNAQYYNFHLGFGIGVACLFWIIRMIRQQMQEKYRFISDLNATIKRRFGSSNAETLVLTDEYIKLESEVIKYEYKWAVITSYLLKDNFIFLIRDSSFSSSVIIDTKLLSQTDLTDLTAFLRKSKPESKEFHKPI